MTPSREELAACRGRRVPDLIRPGLSLLLCGINPSLYSAAVGHHFARPGNRFWKTLHRAGFTERELHPSEEHELLARGIGITNVIPYASASAAELAQGDYTRGARLLTRKLGRYRPRCIAFLGIDAFRRVASRPEACVGPQPDPFAGVRAWALSNPSGLNAHYQLTELAAVYELLARELGFTKSAR